VSQRNVTPRPTPAITSGRPKLGHIERARGCADAVRQWYPGKENDAAGDSVGGRLYHAGAALADAPLHCPHAGPGGADVCATM